MFNMLSVSLRVAMISLLTAFVMLAAAPMASAAKPDRTVITGFDPETIPAGLGCAFDVGLQPVESARQIVTVFDDGRTVTIGHGEPTLTNLETGTSYVQVSRYHVSETYDPTSNEILVEIHGSIFSQFYPGDQGPFGPVGEDGALLAFTGYILATIDVDSGLVTSISNVGTVVDICAELT